MSRISGLSGCFVIIVVSIAAQLAGGVRCSANVTREEVERAIREGVRYLKSQQRADGSWSDVENEAKTGTTSLITLALLDGRREDRLADDSQGTRLPPRLRAQRSEEHLRDRAADHGLRRGRARDTTSCGSPTTSPGWNEPRSSRPIRSTGRARGPIPTRSAPGPATTRIPSTRFSGLHAASEAGVPVKPAVWELARAYWERSQKHNGGWAYTPDSTNQTASMTCAGVSSLIITGLRRFQGPGIPPGRDDSELRQGRNQPQPPGGNQLAGRALPGRVRISVTASSGSSIISMAWSAPAG